VTTSPLFSAIVHIALLPPMCLFLVMAAGALARRRWPRTGQALLRGGFAALLILSTSAGARLLVKPLEQRSPPLTKPGATGAQAIVILAAGSMEDAPEYGGQDIPDEVTLVRLRYGAWLQHATGLPLLVSGGNATADGKLEAKAITMARVLREDFRTDVAWLEARSDNTFENATFSAAILRQHGIKRILLVTDAMHMARAREMFARTGLEVVIAPTMYQSSGPLTAQQFLPTAFGLKRSYYACYEWLGLAWYRLSK
jgi:uncharacterized SAM-binding protein YcdF (DUF218 family)